MAWLVTVCCMPYSRPRLGRIQGCWKSIQTLFVLVSNWLPTVVSEYHSLLQKLSTELEKLDLVLMLPRWSWNRLSLSTRVTLEALDCV